ncbi:MAG: hypothetical protein R3D27_10250 [Hyphomicrobiaceae bacterium]
MQALNSGTFTDICWFEPQAGERREARQRAVDIAAVNRSFAAKAGPAEDLVARVLATYGLAAAASVLMIWIASLVA